MGVQLLDKTRKINKLLHNNHSTKVVFNDICEVMMETLDSNILVISKKGKVLGISLCPGVEEITELIEDKVGGYVDNLLNDRLLSVFPPRKMSTWRLLDLNFREFQNTMPSSVRSTSPVSVSVLYLCTAASLRTILMTSSSVNMEPLW